MNFTRSKRFTVTALVFSAVIAGNAGATGLLTFGFAGEVRNQITEPIPGLLIGDTFSGSYTFDPLTPGVAPNPPESSLVFEYWAVTSWSITLQSSGVTFGGTVGKIAVGNDTGSPFPTDRYKVTLFPDVVSPLVLGGFEFTQFYFDLQVDVDYDGQMLQDDSLPTTPPPLALDRTIPRSGRFVFDGSSARFLLDSLTAVPEPSTATLCLVAGILFGLSRAASGHRNT